MGIDQSYTNTGIVIVDKLDQLCHAALISTNNSADKPARAWQIAEQILALTKKYKPDKIAIEGLAFGMRGSATRDLAGLQFVIICLLRYAKVIEDVQIVSPLTVKKYATGSGKAEKIKLIEALPKQIRETFDEMGVKKTTGLADLTDAYWIARVIQDPNFISQVKKDKDVIKVASNKRD